MSNQRRVGKFARSILTKSIDDRWGYPHKVGWKGKLHLQGKMKQFTDLAYIIVFGHSLKKLRRKEQFDNIRDYASKEELISLANVELEISILIQNNLDYNEIKNKLKKQENGI